MTLTRDKLVEIVLDSFRELFPEVTVTIESRLATMPLDSLHFIELGFALEERSKHIHLDHIEAFQEHADANHIKIETVAQVIDGILEHYKDQPEPEINPPSEPCEACNGRTFAHVDAFDEVSKKFAPGLDERCVNCKTTRPLNRKEVA